MENQLTFKSSKGSVIVSKNQNNVLTSYIPEGMTGRQFKTFKNNNLEAIKNL